MAIVSYQLKGSLGDAPIWWQQFVDDLIDMYPEIDDISVILHSVLQDEYSATLSNPSDILGYSSPSVYILRFENEESHMMFILKYA